MKSAKNKYLNNVKHDKSLNNLNKYLNNPLINDTKISKKMIIPTKFSRI